MCSLVKMVIWLGDGGGGLPPFQKIKDYLVFMVVCLILPASEIWKGLKRLSLHISILFILS